MLTALFPFHLEGVQLGGESSRRRVGAACPRALHGREQVSLRCTRKMSTSSLRWSQPAGNWKTEFIFKAAFSFLWIEA